MELCLPYGFTASCRRVEPPGFDQNCGSVSSLSETFAVKVSSDLDTGGVGGDFLLSVTINDLGIPEATIRPKLVSSAPEQIPPANPSLQTAPTPLLGAEAEQAARKRPKVSREWGAERKRIMLPAVQKASSNRAIWLGGLAIVSTIVLWATYVVSTIIGEIVDNGFYNLRFVLEAASYVLVMSFLTFSALMYLLARQGAFYRIRDHVRVPRANLDDFFSRSVPTLTVLVPSYCEDPAVVRATLLSAALQEYPYMRVALLLDDPPHPLDPKAKASLEECRLIPAQITELLSEPRDRFEAALASYESSARTNTVGTIDEVRILASHYDWGYRWLTAAADAYPHASHIDEFMEDEVLRGLAGDFYHVASALFESANKGAGIPVERLTQLYRGLTWPFRATITSFERKQYTSLSHEANKAMNLNSYIGLMGRSFETIPTPAGIQLTPVSHASSLSVPDSDYVLTLDADSILLREYCLRLIYLMEQPENARVAVSQTPYSAVRGAATRLERIAGATTDIQHILHQGMTHYSATFWVGANAVIRKTALDDIVEVTTVDGSEIRRYVQDRTVIEDTESSIDLIARDWTLVNYPERLSYSATPPDFGSLSVQRSRWANGGLLIMPKFTKYTKASKKAGVRVSWPEKFLRVNYMASICWASFGLIFLLAYPYDSKLLSPIILCAAVPYFLAQASDFHRLGYKRTDIFRVYGFNLILLPVNLAGVLKSLQQAAARAKIPFARTPKVKNRTATPMSLILAIYLIIFFCFYRLFRDYQQGNWGNAIFAAFNGVLTLYALLAFIGLWNSIVDVFMGALQWIRVPHTKGARRRRKEKAAQSALAAQVSSQSWDSVLYFGPGALQAGNTPVPAATRHAQHSDTQRSHPNEHPELCSQFTIVGDSNQLIGAECATSEVAQKETPKISTKKVAKKSADQPVPAKKSATAKRRLLRSRPHETRH